MTTPISSIETAESPDRVRSDSIEIANVYGSGNALVSATADTVHYPQRPRSNVTPVSPVGRINDDALGGNVDFFA